MVYVTTKRSVHQRQMTLDELFDDDYEYKTYGDNASTLTRRVGGVVSDGKTTGVNLTAVYNILKKFNEDTDELHADDMTTKYRVFSIPKRSGGLRRISAPKEDLSNALYRLKFIVEGSIPEHTLYKGAEDAIRLYHTSSFAYIKHRCTIDAVKKHQSNNSRWFAKLDLHDFFGSTTQDFLFHMFSMIFPFSEIMADEQCGAEFRKALSLCFLNGGLPQGTPMSPLLTNIMMIPFDFELSRALRSYGDANKSSFIYTRYADDFIISSKYTFKVSEIITEVKNVLAKFDAPFMLNEKKTRYGSSAGSNWNLGVMLNKDNEITIGHAKKKQFQAMLTSYILDRKNGKPWDLNDVQTLDGYRSYYYAVEGEKIEEIIKKIGQKFGANIRECIREDIASFTA